MRSISISALGERSCSIGRESRLEHPAGHFDYKSLWAKAHVKKLVFPLGSLMFGVHLAKN